MKRPRLIFFLILTLVGSIFFVSPPKLYAGDNENFYYLSRGFFRVLTAVFQIPRYLIQRTLTEPIGLGTVDGVLDGTFYAVSELSQGALEMGRGAAPYAKYLVFFA